MRGRDCRISLRSCCGNVQYLMLLGGSWLKERSKERVCGGRREEENYSKRWLVVGQEVVPATHSPVISLTLTHSLTHSPQSPHRIRSPVPMPLCQCHSANACRPARCPFLFLCASFMAVGGAECRHTGMPSGWTSGMLGYGGSNSGRAGSVYPSGK